MRNPKPFRVVPNPETRNPKPETDTPNHEPQISSPKPEAEIRNPKPEGRSQRSSRGVFAMFSLTVGLGFWVSGYLSKIDVLLIPRVPHVVEQQRESSFVITYLSESTCCRDDFGGLALCHGCWNSRFQCRGHILANPSNLSVSVLKVVWQK